ncbi:MAG: LptF/LptG family permease [Treponema sp.]|jgi:lipopolysaccharide export system permease protein|nr:LptF/LptG family permease [Treponema sp.]
MILDRYLLKQFFPVFFVALSMFMLLMSLVDLFANLVRYLSYNVPLTQILKVSLYYLPKSCSFALPMAILFAAAYTLGELYARNELTSIFSAGIPFWRFTVPFVVLGILISFLSFFFEDNVVIPTFKLKTDLGRFLLHQQPSENNSDIVIKTRGGKLIYAADYYDDATVSLNGVSIIEQGDEGNFLSLIRAPRAVWGGEYWIFSNPLIYAWEGNRLQVRPLEETTAYREHPDTFRRSAVDVESLHAGDALLLVNDLKKAGLPYIPALADYYHRFSFSATPFLVIILAISMGGRFRKNVLLMSLLTSLMVTVGFYVTEMVTMMMGKLGYIPPLAGAWFPVLLFVVIGLILLKGAKT